MKIRRLAVQWRWGMVSQLLKGERSRVETPERIEGMAKTTSNPKSLESWICDAACSTRGAKTSTGPKVKRMSPTKLRFRTLRGMFCFLRSFFVPRQEAEQVTELLSRQDMEGRWLPEKPSVIYTFAGEIPWCQVLPENGFGELSFIVGEETVKVTRNRGLIVVDGQPLDLKDVDAALLSQLDDFLGSEGNPPKGEGDSNRIEFRDSPIEEEETKPILDKRRVMIPVRDFGWEGYQSSTSDAGSATVLAKEIATDLELVGQPQSFDLVSKDGVRASCGVSDHGNVYRNRQEMFFVRESLLRTYLDRHELAPVWVVWGERKRSTNELNRMHRDSSLPGPHYVVFSSVKLYP